MEINPFTVIFLWIIFTSLFVLLLIRNFVKYVLKQRLWFAQKINFKLFIILFVAIIIPVSAISFFSYFVLKQFFKESLRARDITNFNSIYRYFERKLILKVRKLKKPPNLSLLKKYKSVCIKYKTGKSFGDCRNNLFVFLENRNESFIIIKKDIFYTWKYKSTAVFLPITESEGKHFIELREILDKSLNLLQNQNFFLKNYILNLIFWITLSVFGSLWLATFLGRNFTAFLNNLISALDEVSKGNLNFRIQKVESLELDFISRKFNYMLSELKKFQAILEENKKELEAIVNNCGIGIGIYEKNRFTFANIFLKSIFTKLPLDKIEKLITEVTQYLLEADNRAPTTISRIVSCNSTIFSVFFTVLDLKNRRFVVSVRDVTDLVEAERGILLRDLLSKISHEVKNPLMPIESKLKKLLEISPSSDLEEVYDRFVNFKRLLLELVSSLKLQNVKISDFSLPELIFEIIKTFNSPSKDVNFLVMNPSGVDTVSTDRVILSLALKNVIENAFNFANTVSTVDVTIEKENSIITVSVTNEGPTIPSDIVERIFEPYFTTSKSGSGLGLYLSRTVLNSIGGEVKLLRSENGLTTFQIKFPIYSSD